jgi:hypothetical protein
VIVVASSWADAEPVERKTVFVVAAAVDPDAPAIAAPTTTAHTHLLPNGRLILGSSGASKGANQPGPTLPAAGGTVQRFGA